MHSIFSVACAIVVLSSLLQPYEKLLQINPNLIPSEAGSFRSTASANSFCRSLYWIRLSVSTVRLRILCCRYQCCLGANRSIVANLWSLGNVQHEAKDVFGLCKAEDSVLSLFWQRFTVNRTKSGRRKARSHQSVAKFLRCYAETGTSAHVHQEAVRSPR